MHFKQKEEGDRKGMQRYESVKMLARPKESKSRERRPSLKVRKVNEPMTSLYKTFISSSKHVIT